MILLSNFSYQSALCVGTFGYHPPFTAHSRGIRRSMHADSRYRVHAPARSVPACVSTIRHRFHGRFWSRSLHRRTRQDPCMGKHLGALMGACEHGMGDEPGERPQCCFLPLPSSRYDL